jgi:hypothetical protein
VSEDEDGKLRLVNPEPELPEPDPDDPRFDLTKPLHVVTEDGFCLDRWPDNRTPEQKAKDDAEFQAEMKKAAAWLRSSLTALLAKHVLPFRPKRSPSSTPPTRPNPSQGK